MTDKSSNNRSIEKLHHFSCASCKKWWTVADAPEDKSEWFCPWCGNVQQYRSNREPACRQAGNANRVQNNANMNRDKADKKTLSAEARSLKPGIYEHFKGNRYEVIGVARHSETLEEFVAYRALYGDRGLWIRPLAMFLEMIERDDKVMPRFRYVGEK